MIGDDIDRFMERFIKASSEDGGLPYAEPDPEFISPCFVDSDGHWRPVRRSEPYGVEVHGIHPGAREWIGRYWRLSIEAVLDGQPLILMSIMNDQELESVMADIELHRANQVRGAKSVPIGMFLDGRNISISDDGTVIAEAPGQRSVALSQDLSEFLTQVEFY